MTTAVVSEVDRIEPPHKLVALGLQHVLVMYAGAVAVPLIIAVGEGVKYRGISRDVVAALIGALILDLVALGAWLAYKKEVRFRARALPERGTLIALRTLSDGKTGLDLSVEMAGRQPWLVTSVSKIPEIVLPRLVSGEVVGFDWDQPVTPRENGHSHPILFTAERQSSV